MTSTAQVLTAVAKTVVVKGTTVVAASTIPAAITVNVSSGGNGLAIVGVVVASLALGWNIVVALRDRGRLSVSATTSRILGDQSAQPYFQVTVTNVGRRAVHVSSVAGRLRTKTAEGFGQFIFRDSGVPRLLQEAETFTFHQIFRPDQHGNIGDIYAITSTNEKFSLGFRARRRLMKDVDLTVSELKAGRKEDSAIFS